MAETKNSLRRRRLSELVCQTRTAQQKTNSRADRLRFGRKIKCSSERASLRAGHELKNVPKLLVKVYEINPRNYYRAFNRPLSTDIDLDGLVANAQRQSSIRNLPIVGIVKGGTAGLTGRGAWVFDLSAAGNVRVR